MVTFWPKFTTSHHQKVPHNTAYQNQICSKEADVLQLFEGCLDAALLLARPRFGGCVENMFRWICGTCLNQIQGKFDQAWGIL